MSQFSPDEVRVPLALDAILHGAPNPTGAQLTIAEHRILLGDTSARISNSPAPSVPDVVADKPTPEQPPASTTISADAPLPAVISWEKIKSIRQGNSELSGYTGPPDIHVRGCGCALCEESSESSGTRMTSGSRRWGRNRHGAW